MSPLQAGILTIFSCASLVIALYCLFFMVPVKRFWERIRTLGGGLKGIEAHVDGMRENVSRRLDELEGKLKADFEERRRENKKTLERLARRSRSNQGDLESLRKDIQELQAELRETAAGAGKVARKVNSLATRLEQIRGDLDAQEAELQRAVQQQVTETFASVESTVLAALESVQEEILYGVSGAPPQSPRPSPCHKPDAAPGPRDNIIKVEPLFGNIGGEEDDQPEGQQEGEPTPEDEEEN